MSLASTWLNSGSVCLYTENEASMFLEEDTHVKKRCCTVSDGAEEDFEVAEGLPLLYHRDSSFEDLCGSATFCKQESDCSKTEVGSWGLLDGHILARIFHFLRTDVKSLVFASSTCKHWRSSVVFYKSLSVRIDLSTMGSKCTDSVIRSVMVGVCYLSFSYFIRLFVISFHPQFSYLCSFLLILM